MSPFSYPRLRHHAARLFPSRRHDFDATIKPPEYQGAAVAAADFDRRRAAFRQLFNGQ